MDKISRMYLPVPFPLAKPGFFRSQRFGRCSEGVVFHRLNRPSVLDTIASALGMSFNTSSAAFFSFRPRSLRSVRFLAPYRPLLTRFPDYTVI